MAQCKTPSLPLPASSQIKQDVLSICADMWMDGCEQCVAANRSAPTLSKRRKLRLICCLAYQKCDVFKVYLNLCAAMPNMQQCADWSAVCAHVPQWDVCGGSVGGGASYLLRNIRSHFDGRKARRPKCVCTGTRASRTTSSSKVCSVLFLFAVGDFFYFVC